MLTSTKIQALDQITGFKTPTNPVMQQATSSRADEIRKLAQPATPAPAPQSFMQKVGDVVTGKKDLASAISPKLGAIADKTQETIANVEQALAKSEKAFGDDIAAAIGGSAYIDKLNEINKADQDAITLFVQKRNEARKNGDKKVEDHFQKLIQNYQMTDGGSATEVFPALAKTNLQVLGDAAGVVTDIAAAGALKGVKGFGIATKATQTAEQAVKARQAYQALSTTGKVLEIAKGTGKAALAGAGIGYAYDVSSRAQENELDLKPGIGTAVGATLPITIGGVKIVGAIAKDQAPRIVNSLIGTTKKNFVYGKNPGRAIAEEGITANSLPDLEDKVTQARQKAGSAIGDITSNLEGKARLQSLDDSLSSIDDAMNKAASQNNPTLLQRLQNVKDSLTKYLVRDSAITPEYSKHFIDNAVPQLQRDGQVELANRLKSLDLSKVTSLSELQKAVVDNLGEESLQNRGISNWLKTTADMVQARNPELAKGTIIAMGERNLKNPTFNDALNFKRTIGDVTAFTGNPSDDKAVNSALKNAYGSVKESMNKAAMEADPTLGQQLIKANEKYADLISAEAAIRNKIANIQGRNLVSMPIKVGTVAGIITSLATGGAAVPAVLAGVGAGLLDKALASTAVKTRIAAYLGKESPEIIAGVIQKNPGIGAVLKRAFSKEYTPIENALKDLKNIPNKEGGFISVGGKRITPEIRDRVSKELNNYDSSVLTVNGGPDLSNPDRQLRLSALKEKLDKRALSDSEIAEVAQLLKIK